MSEWYQADPDDVEVDVDSKEFNVLVHDNYAGNVYVTIKFDIVKRMYGEIVNLELLNYKEDE